MAPSWPAPRIPMRPWPGTRRLIARLGSIGSLGMMAYPTFAEQVGVFGRVLLQCRLPAIGCSIWLVVRFRHLHLIHTSGRATIGIGPPGYFQPKSRALRCGDRAQPLAMTDAQSQVPERGSSLIGRSAGSRRAEAFMPCESRLARRKMGRGSQSLSAR